MFESHHNFHILTQLDYPTNRQQQWTMRWCWQCQWHDEEGTSRRRL